MSRKIPAPVKNAETEPFWKAAAEGKLLLRTCQQCSQPHFYPRTICPFCGSDRTEWQQSSGRGTIYSYSVMRRVPDPYAIAFVNLAEGPTMMTNLVECDFDALAIGQPVEVVFRAAEDGSPVPMFRPLPSAAAD
jgi:uncharacterized OB-fold protein